MNPRVSQEKEKEKEEVKQEKWEKEEKIDFFLLDT